MYISLARKYRPRTFADVAVQSHVSTTLKGAIARGRVAHGYLLCGPRGVGKTTLARVLAMALNCERRAAADAPGAGEPCGECASCQRIWSGSASLDVVEIDAASNRGVDDARDLRERAMYAPSGEGRYKVYIVDEAHMLTREAWNALLKILEEPPPRVVFVFATTEPQKIAQAAAPVLSRLQRFDFKRIGPADVRQRLATVLAAERVEAEPDALTMLARAADGSMRDALSLTDQALSLGDGTLTAARVREALGLVAEDEYLAILDLVAERRAGEIFPAIARLVDEGVDLGGFLGGLADMLRAELEVVLGGEGAELSERAREALSQRAGRFSAGDLLRMLTGVTELEPRFRKSGQQQILLETLLVRFALMDRTVSLEDVLRELGPERGGGDDDRGTPAPRDRTPPRPSPTAPAGSRSAPAASAPSFSSPRSPAPEPGAASAPRAASPAPVNAPPAPHAPRPASPEPRAPSPEPRAPRPESRTAHPAQEPLSINRLVERWDDVVARARADGRLVLAAALQHALPVSVTGRGEITLELDGGDAAYQQPIADAASDVLSAVGALFTGATRVAVRVGDGGGAAAAPRRLTEEGIRSERLATLRKRDAALDIAIDALDLELID